ncbi:hypothetical protein ACFSHQ_03005 [Gemmobacter lanyuensis]
MLRLTVEIDGKRHELGLPAGLLASLPAAGAVPEASLSQKRTRPPFWRRLPAH